MVSIEEGLIKDKIKSYIYQDCETLGMNAECKEKGNKSLPKNYIEVNDVKILIEVQDNKCYICKEPFKEYNAGCKNQLTFFYQLHSFLCLLLYKIIIFHFL